MAKLADIEIPCPNCKKVQRLPAVASETKTRVRTARGDAAVVTIRVQSVQHMCEGS